MRIAKEAVVACPDRSAALRIRKGLEASFSCSYVVPANASWTTCLDSQEAKPEDVSQALDDAELSNVGPHASRKNTRNTLSLFKVRWSMLMCVLVQGHEDGSGPGLRGSQCVQENLVCPNFNAVRSSGLFLPGRQ